MVLLVALEVSTRTIVEKESNVQRELNEEYREAVQIQKQPGAKTRQLLIVGNSLVGHSLDFDLIRRQLGPDWQVHRYWIYNTTYDDWYFGLRRMFAEGSRPDTVAVTFAALHWFVSATRGEYSAAYLFRAADIPALASELALDRTATSNLLFARYSKFYALRSETRKAVLETILPDLPRMYDLLQPGESNPWPSKEVLDLMTQRIAKMRQLAERNGAHLVLIVPPIIRPGQEYHSELALAARKAGVEAFMPMSGSDLPSSDFADDMHLTREGATLYTTRLLSMLKPALDGRSKPVVLTSGKGPSHRSNPPS